MRVWKHLPPLALAAGLVFQAACGAEVPPEEPAAESPAPETTASTGGAPRVFFIEPQDGATVKSPVRLVFGIENYEIAPVPAGTVETVRPQVGHHHVGVDTDCLPPGTVVPMAAPWVHFGKGDNQIDMQLPPGSHRLTLQLGDDKHVTIEGLCTTITVTVAE
jgi:hypothetical protein